MDCRLQIDLCTLYVGDNLAFQGHCTTGQGGGREEVGGEGDINSDECLGHYLLQR